MRLLLALGVAAAFAATGPIGFAQGSRTGQNQNPTANQNSSDRGTPIYSQPGYHPGGASAKDTKAYKQSQSGQPGNTSTSSENKKKD